MYHYSTAIFSCSLLFFGGGGGGEREREKEEGEGGTLVRNVTCGGIPGPRLDDLVLLFTPFLPLCLQHVPE